MSDLYTMCALCGKRSGQHKAGTGHCPMGAKGRANTYSFSPTQRFIPKLPKLPVSVLKVVGEFHEAARDGTDFIQREYALHKLLHELTEDRKTLERVKAALANSLDTRKTFTF